jgi:hypothetical protein
MSRFVDSIDYQADNVVIAPYWEWRIMEINIARVTKVIPRYCQPTCPEYRKDIDFSCKVAHECTSFIFDQHLAKRNEKVFDVLFATNTNNPHEGLAWRVGEDYFRTMVGNKKVDRMIDDYLALKELSKEGFKLPDLGGFKLTDGGDEDGK